MQKTHLISGVITFMIVTTLILAGPVQAFILSLSIDDNTISKGENVSFTAKVDLTHSEFLEIDNLSINIFGPNSFSLSCVFDVDGNELSGCEDVTIELIETPTFGYGYGYGYDSSGNLEYNITINSDALKAGDYSSKLVLMFGDEENLIDGPGFEILAKAEKVEICHIPPGNPDNAHTISIGSPAVDAHLAHGDSLGACEEINSNSVKGNKGKGQK